MKRLPRYFIGGGLVVIFVAAGYWVGRLGAPNCVRVVKFEESASKGGGLGNWPQIDNQYLAESVQIAGYRALSPLLPKDMHIDRTLWIFAKDNLRSVALDPNMVQIFIGLGKPNSCGLAVMDIDKKGTYDAVQYDIFDNKGNVVGQVTDLDRDGQADVKLYRGSYGKPDRVYYFIDGNWYLKKNIGGKFIVFDSGRERAIEKFGRKFRFAEQ